MDANVRLEQALKAKDPRRVKLALSKGADANLRIGRDGRSALTWAVLVGGAAIVFALLEAGARVIEEDAETTSLHEAARSGNLDVLRALLSRGGKRHVNRFDREGCTPLMAAVAAGKLEAAKLLLEAGAKVNAQRDAWSGSALRVAVATGTLEMVRTLVEAGADANQMGRLMLTPLDRAKQRATPEGRMIAVYLQRHLDKLAESHAAERRMSRRRVKQGRRRQLTGRKR